MRGRDDFYSVYIPEVLPVSMPVEATGCATSFPRSLFFPPPGEERKSLSLAPGGGKKRDPGNEAAGCTLRGLRSSLSKYLHDTYRRVAERNIVNFTRGEGVGVLDPSDVDIIMGCRKKTPGIKSVEFACMSRVFSIL